MSKVVWSMFDGSGYAVKDWAEAGHTCYCINADQGDHGDYANLGARIIHPNIHYVNAWIDKAFLLGAIRGNCSIPQASIILAFPPCTDLANSGSRSWAKKRVADPDFQVKAAATAQIAAWLAKAWNIPFVIENPMGMLSTLWRKPDVYVHPWEFGGYIPEVDRLHPHFPQYISARDAYPKKTGLWYGNGFIMPEKQAVYVDAGLSKQYKKLGGNSPRTKVIRSLTPRGLARAIFEANQ